MEDSLSVCPCETDRIPTFTSMLPTLAEDLMIGLPTSEGKMCVGKLEPA